MKENWILLKSITLPWEIEISRGNKFTLNLNQYRNTHYFKLNLAKKMFGDIIGPPCIPKQDKLKIKYVIHRKGKKRFDTMNVLAIADKFLLDHLVNCSVVSDDCCDKVFYFAPEVVPDDDTFIVAEVYGCKEVK